MITTLSTEYPSLAQEKLEDILRLIRSENVGPVTFFKLFTHFGSISRVLDAIPEMSIKGGRAKAIKIASKADIVKEMEQTEKLGARFIVYGSSEYPAWLNMLHDAPPVITVLGNAKIWQKGLNLGMVGARNASANGCRFAMKLAADLGKSDVAIISGLARGIDAAAHTGALQTGTVGVIAGGIDTIYPPENESLYIKMREQGAIIAEQAFGHAPQARNFPARNRIISGMSHGLLVVEASLKSGSLITARLAAEQNRDVFAVPGSPMDPRANGTNQLLKDGAILTETAEDVLAHLTRYQNIQLHTQLLEGQKTDYQPAAPKQPQEAELATARLKITEKLGHSPVLVDELLIQCQLTSGVLATILLETELAGRLQRHPGNRVSLSIE